MNEDACWYLQCRVTCYATDNMTNMT